MTHKVTNAVRRLGARRLSLAMIAIALVVWVIVVTGLGDFRSDRYSSISITGQNSCGLRTDGSVVCWGYSSALAPMGETVHRCRCRQWDTVVVFERTGVSRAGVIFAFLRIPIPSNRVTR